MLCDDLKKSLSLLVKRTYSFYVFYMNWTAEQRIQISPFRKTYRSDTKTIVDPKKTFLPPLSINVVSKKQFVESLSENGDHIKIYMRNFLIHFNLH